MRLAFFHVFPYKRTEKHRAVNLIEMGMLTSAVIHGWVNEDPRMDPATLSVWDA